MSILTRIAEYIHQLRIIDGHEHILTSDFRRGTNAGVFRLMHYLDSDLINAGVKRGTFHFASPISDEEKANIFIQYWAKTQNTTYALMYRWIAEDLYGMNTEEPWTADYMLVWNEKVREATRNDPQLRLVSIRAA